IDEVAVAEIKKKIESPMVSCNLRLLASAGTEAEALEILEAMESSFNQFQNATGNSIKWKAAKKGELQTLVKNFSFRLFNENAKLPLNLKEITTMIHFHTALVKSGGELKQSRSATAPAPVDIPRSGILLGVNKNRAAETKVFMGEDDRLRHFYTIGQTGTGKSTLLKNMIIQDILAGNGVCMIDPHGNDIVDVLGNIPPERLDDLIYFDPAYTARPMALNMLEYDPNFPEQKTFVVNELFGIFRKLYGNVPEAMGPAFEQYFRNSALLVMEDPESGNTLVDMSRVLSDKSYRALKLSKCKNPLISQFWTNAEKTTGEQGLSNYVQYVTNKFDVFLANDIMRPIITQEKSSFNFREIMDNKKILLVNLSKGRLGDINANLIGLILVGKILMAALSRVDLFGKDFPPFYLYLDEFQNITTDSIATILSEARKYKLSLNIAHQFIAQLEENIRDAVFGNVGSICSFRIGADDAEVLEKQFTPTFSSFDLMNIDNRNAYLKLLVNGKPVKPFNIETLPPPQGDPSKIEMIKELSYQKYGHPREEVEALIMQKYKINPTPTPPLEQGRE
ncbi:MAG: TraM recognition domain-containing protein, partial [Patescibacteria group bacterium]